MEYSKEEFKKAVEGVFDMVSSVDNIETQNDLIRVVELRCGIELKNIRILETLTDIP